MQSVPSVKKENLNASKSEHPPGALALDKWYLVYDLNYKLILLSFSEAFRQPPRRPSIPSMILVLLVNTTEGGG